MDYLELPLVDFYQLRIDYKTIDIEDSPNTKNKLDKLLKEIDENKTTGIVRTKKNFKEDVEGGTAVITEEGLQIANFDLWLMDIAKESFNLVSYSELQKHQQELEKIFSKIVYTLNGHTVFNEMYNRYSINSEVRLSFSAKRKLKTEEELIKKDVQLLLAENLLPFEKNENYFPLGEDINKILEMDKNANREKEIPSEIDEEKVKAVYQKQVKAFKEMGMENSAPKYEEFRKQFDLSLAVKSKNNTFHYLPYNFWQSKFEMKIHKELIMLKEFKDLDLEVYYNGERGLTGFVINCFAKETKYWRNIGKYTPDFLIIKRKKKELHKILILETKGEGYAEQTEFINRKKYVETEFIKRNNEKFGYKRFDFLYLQDDDNNLLTKLNKKFVDFFND